MSCSQVSRSLAALIGVSVVLVAAVPVLAQVDPCAEGGPDCRLLTPAEVNAIKARLLALKAAMPVPDTARWALSSDIGMAFMISFIAELEAGGPMISGSWPAGAFTERNDVHLIYDGLVKPATKAKAPKDPLAAIEQMQAELGNRIEILAQLLPYPYLLYNIDGDCVDVTESEATDIERTPTLLSYMYNDGAGLRMVFGQRTCKEEETLRAQKPAPHLAPVKSIVLEITGPSRGEVLAIKKKIDRQAFEALLGPVLK